MDDRLNPTDQGETSVSPELLAGAEADEAVRGRYGEPWSSVHARTQSPPPESERSNQGSGEGDGSREGSSETPDHDRGGGSGIVSHLQNVAEPFADHIVAPVAGAIGSMIEAASAAWSLRESAVDRRLRRQAREPLLNLYEACPEARLASPRELGMRFVPVEEIVGTAVAGIAQRGGDFLPLKPFRGENWMGRWQRIREANERLQPLPPVDLVKFGGEYWVVDGHNRVAATLYANGVGLDAMVTELVPLDGQTSERPSNLLSLLGEGEELRAIASGRRPAMVGRPMEPRVFGETTHGPEEADEQGEPHQGGTRG